MGAKAETVREERAAWDILAAAVDLMAELSERGGNKGVVPAGKLDVVKRTQDSVAKAFVTHRQIYEKRMAEEFRA